MADLADGESTEMQGSGSKPYLLKNMGGVYSCSCPAWRNQSLPIEKRSCKHLRKLRGDAAENARVGGAAPAPRPAPTKKASAPAAGKAAQAGAPGVLLAHAFADLESPPDPKDWWMSEKLDGVRAYWDGKTFLSRLGKPRPDVFPRALGG